jgi:hypothetical protein
MQKNQLMLYFTQACHVSVFAVHFLFNLRNISQMPVKMLETMDHNLLLLLMKKLFDQFLKNIHLNNQQHKLLKHRKRIIYPFLIEFEDSYQIFSLNKILFYSFVLILHQLN